MSYIIIIIINSPTSYTCVYNPETNTCVGNRPSIAKSFLQCWSLGEQFGFNRIDCQDCKNLYPTSDACSSHCTYIVNTCLGNQPRLKNNYIDCHLLGDEFGFNGKCIYCKQYSSENNCTDPACFWADNQCRARLPGEFATMTECNLLGINFAL
jgi:hypothetical protein